jgi:integrase/recombinase XerD
LRGLIAHLATERGLANNSLLAYRRDLEDLQRFLEPLAKTLTTFDADDVRAYLRELSQRKLDTKTLARRIAAIRAFLRYLILGGFDTEKIATLLAQLERPKPSSDLPTVMNRSQVNRLIAAPKPEHRFFDRDVAVLELLYASGLRASELCGLVLRDVNLPVGCVRVLGKGMKERVVPFGRAASEAISRYVNDCRPKLNHGNIDTVFLSRSGKPLERVALWMLVRKHAKAAGFGKEMHTHVLRHCFATHLLGGGADLRVVQELLGHADVATTQIYTHVDADRLKSIHGKFHPRG